MSVVDHKGGRQGALLYLPPSYCHEDLVAFSSVWALIKSGSLAALWLTSFLTDVRFSAGPSDQINRMQILKTQTETGSESNSSAQRQARWPLLVISLGVLASVAWAWALLSLVMRLLFS